MGGEAAGRRFSRRLPGAAFELVPTGGHAPWVDEPEFCAARTAACLGAGTS